MTNSLISQIIAITVLSSFGDLYFTDTRKLFKWNYTFESCSHDLCMDFTFRCKNTKVSKGRLFANRINRANCSFVGHFEGYENEMVAISTNECPRTESSILELSFSIPDVCPLNTFFLAFPNGTGYPHYDDLNHMELSDGVLANISYDFMSLRFLGPNDEFQLTDNFILRLRIFYDDNFHERFGDFANERLNAIMVHVQALYLMESLPNKLYFDILSIDHISNHTIKPTMLDLR